MSVQVSLENVGFSLNCYFGEQTVDGSRVYVNIENQDVQFGLEIDKGNQELKAG